MERKLASIQRIAEIKPIEGADAIEAVRVNGWWVVAKKDDFKVGDLAVYFEIDSVIPVRPEFEFLRKGCYVQRDWLQTPNNEGFRLRTIKLRGQVSQGLVVPASITGEEGDDLTERMGVVKWDPPLSAQLTGQAKGNFPSFIRKTDQERVQNLTQRGFIPGRYQVEEKLDGSSCTVFFNNGEFGVCSRNLQLEFVGTENSFINTVLKTRLNDALIKYGKNIALQGELCGPGIQGNKYKLPDFNLYVFDVFFIDEQRKATPLERREVLMDLRDGHNFNILEVPVMRDVELHYLNVPVLLEIADGPSELNMLQPREGLVFKSYADGDYSFKAISNQFLLKEK